MLDDKNNYFSLFNLKVAFILDEDYLDKTWRDLSNLAHPDRYVGFSKVDQSASVRLMSFINEAYYNLRNPIKRARYICELNGIDFDNADSFNDSNFLLEQMELRDLLTNIIEQRNIEALDIFIKELQNKKIFVLNYYQFF
ncbi:Fe-S protein assembly co-chaperone HscB [Candidatus Kinetoplastidibacterium crithidiae]|uniref:Molecular chaperone HscB n=1 Tax=Candidatus Kinetoplastidibacterium crithidiae TCC036E TaxID=1208918 RepID=M1LPE1_9PROT|nr:Fe-S protein assembly co-chaperone HscB [Candidatus Kinetoplastibacterium crithidii]AGF47542.1 molecular chaperone HscB [Candidatus Kinetoplastibacterium crithidii TCC036E]